MNMDSHGEDQEKVNLYDSLMSHAQDLAGHTEPEFDGLPGRHILMQGVHAAETRHRSGTAEHHFSGTGLFHGCALSKTHAHTSHILF